MLSLKAANSDVLSGSNEALLSAGLGVAALAAIVGKPIRVSRVRAGRRPPGLRPQHLTGLQLVRAAHEQQHLYEDSPLKAGIVHSVSMSPGLP